MRRARRRRFSSGFRSASSIHRKADSAIAATIDSLTMNGEPNQSSLLPSSSTVCSAARPIAMVAIPAQSPSRSSDSFIGCDSSETNSKPIMTAPGTRLT
ncbi:hypothetical protein ACVWXN_004812 [Bradyrhizobium sp. i1.4.4]